jgi:hypothetical protein
MPIEFLYWEDCPSHPEALARLRQAMAAEGVTEAIEIIRVDTDEQAERYRFPGSPTIRIDGIDLQPEGAQGQARLTCRTYRTEDGRLSPLPTVTLLRRALRARRHTTEEVDHAPGHS